MVNTKESPKTRLTKKEIENKKLIAYTMYFAFEDNKVIAEAVGVTPKTITDWVNEGKWKSKRTASTITRDELVNKCLSALNIILEKAMEDGADMSKLPDDLIKMGNTIEKLDKRNNVVYNIETFIGFNKFLLGRMPDDKTLTPELLKTINKLQNDYTTYRMNG